MDEKIKAKDEASRQKAEDIEKMRAKDQEQKE